MEASRDPAGGLSRPAEWFEENPHAKISFSRLAVFRRCPAWYRYQYLEWHRAWSAPVTRAGHAVQAAFEEVVHVQPPAEADQKALLQWAQDEAGRLFAPLWEAERLAHEADPNGFGEWDLSSKKYEGFLRNAVRFHVEEVLARSEGRHPRGGQRLALEPEDDLVAAWRAVVPQHAPDATPLSGMESVPGGFFQGQYDLVYDWTGGRRIVDLKASEGTSCFSTEIGLQLLAYSYIERALGRGRPEGIEAWFLGRSNPDVFPVPEDEEIDAFEADVKELIDRAGYLRGFGQWRAEDFPVAPSPVSGHESAPGDASPWCRFCPAATVCPASATQAPEAEPGIRFDAAVAGGPVSLRGIVLGVGLPSERRGKTTRRFTLANTSGVRSFSWEASVVQGLADAGLRAGRVVLIENLNPWRHPRSGDVLYYPTARTALRVEG